MKTIISLYVIFGLILLVPGFSAFSQVGIGTNTPDSSSMLDISSTNKGILIPRLTASQRTGINSPSTALLVYQIDSPAGFYFYNGTTWTFLGIAEGYSSNVIDIDGNGYRTVKIGDQEWMAENLRVTHYCNGDPVPNITDNTAWINLTTGARCYYSNDSSTYNTIYGTIYNWYTLVDSRKICPMNWHIPSDAEWTILSTYLGGVNEAGGKMKTAMLWNAPNTSVTNTSGFSGLPGGLRSYLTGLFGDVGYWGYWWSSTEQSITYIWIYYLVYNVASLNKTMFNKTYGLSVRCIRN